MPTLSFRTIYVSHVLAYAQARTFRGSGDSRNLVIGGAEAEIGRHPYMVSLQDEHTHFCGASLIAPDIVLTAGKLMRFIYFVILFYSYTIVCQLCLISPLRITRFVRSSWASSLDGRERRRAPRNLRAYSSSWV